MTQNKVWSKCSGTCATCKSNDVLIVSDATIQAEALGDFLASKETSKYVGKQILNNPGRGFDNAANIETTKAKTYCYNCACYYKTCSLKEGFTSG